MLTVLLVIQAIVALAMIVLILIQHTSADGLSGLSGGGGGNALMSGRASANLQSKTTAILATIFMANSLLMATVTARDFQDKKSITESIVTEEKAVTATEAGDAGDESEETNSVPSAPIAE